MKQIIYQAFLILLLLIVLCGGFEIKFKPFSIKFENPYALIGFVFILMGCMLIYAQGHENAWDQIFKKK